MARVEDARLDVYWPFTSGGPDLQIPRDDIKSVELRETWQAGRGEGTIVIDNGAFESSGTYNGVAGSNTRVAEVDHGQRIEFRALTEYNASSDTLNDAAALRGTGFINNVRRTLTSDGPEIELDVEEFVFAVLARNQVVDSFRDVLAAEDAGGAGDAGIVNQIVDRIDRIDDAGVETVSEALDITVNYDAAIEALRDVAIRSGSIMWAERTSLQWTDTLSLSVDHVLTSSAYHLPITLETAGDEYDNRIFATGGTGEKVQASDTNTPDTQSLSSRAIGEPITIASGRISRVDLHTDKVNDVDYIRCRVQNTDGSGNPEDATDRAVDLDSAVVRADNITDGGWTAFGIDIRDGSIDGSKVILIAEEIDRTAGVTSHQAVNGTDSDGDGDLDRLAHRVYRSYPTVGIAEDRTGIDDYGLSEGVIRRETPSRDAAQNVAQGALARSTPPPETLTLDAANAATHQATPGDVFQVSVDEINANSNFVTTGVDRSFAGPQLDTSLSLIDIRSL